MKAVLLFITCLLALVPVIMTKGNPEADNQGMD